MAAVGTRIDLERAIRDDLSMLLQLGAIRRPNS
jgi:hypothetical protein